MLLPSRHEAASRQSDDNDSVRCTLILAAFFVSCLAVSRAQISATVSLSNGVQMQIKTKLGQPTGQTVNIEMVRATGDSFYRIFRDQNNLATFAYELVIHLDSSGNPTGKKITLRAETTIIAAGTVNVTPYVLSD